MKKWRGFFVVAVALALTAMFSGKATAVHGEECTEHVYDYLCDHLCNECGAYRQVVHSFSTECSNEKYCWKECACGRIADYRPHQYESESSKWCKHCGYKREITHEFTLKGQDELYHWEKCACGAGKEKKLHTYSGDTCSYCGHKKPDWYKEDMHREINGEEYVSLEEAAAYIRAHLVARDTGMEIRFYYEIDKSMEFGEAYSLLYEEVCKHTGKATEGAILESTWGGTTTNPEAFFDGNVNYITIKNWFVSYASTAEQEQWLTDEIHRIFDELKIDTMTDYEKIYTIYKYICDHVSYGLEIYDPMWNNSHTVELTTAYWALKNGSAICDGYGDLVYRMMMEAGIDTRIISGTVGAHEWNIVKLDGKYYCLDATNDHGQEEYQHFLLGLSEFRENVPNASHLEDPEFHTEEFWEECPVSFTSYGKTLPENGDVVASGKGWNDESRNMHWELTRDGLLTITGPGKIDFPYWKEWKGFIKKIVIEEGITEIGACVFQFCPDLREVVIPKSVTVLDSQAFCYCDRLESVSLPEGLTYIGHSVFEGCNALKEVIVPDNVEYIGEGAFRMSASLEKVVLPKKLKKIEKQTFWRCESLREVVMYEGIEEIGAWAFQECTALEELVLPGTVKVLGAEAFHNAFTYKKNVTLVLPESITSIGSSCFKTCNIGELVWNASINCVDSWLFDNCRCLKSIVLGDTVTKLDDRAFSYCVSLESITWSPNLTEVGEAVFTNCTALQEVVIPATITEIGKEMFYRCSGLKSLVISEGITKVGEMAFGECTSLPEITLPSSVEKIGQYSFSWCNFNKVIFEGAPPKTLGSDPFGSFFGTAYYWADRGEWTEKAMKRLGTSGGVTWVNMLEAGNEEPGETVTPEPTEVPSQTTKPTEAPTPTPIPTPSDATDVETSVQEKEPKDNTMIIILIAAAVVLIGGAGIGVALKKKQKK